MLMIETCGNKKTRKVWLYVEVEWRFLHNKYNIFGLRAIMS